MNFRPESKKFIIIVYFFGQFFYFRNRIINYFTHQLRLTWGPRTFKYGPELGPKIGKFINNAINRTRYQRRGGAAPSQTRTIERARLCGIETKLARKDSAARRAFFGKHPRRRLTPGRSDSCCAACILRRASASRAYASGACAAAWALRAATWR